MPMRNDAEEQRRTSLGSTVAEGRDHAPRAEAFGAVGTSEASLFTLVGNDGMLVQITDYGATIVRLEVPVADERRDVVLGFDALAGAEGRSYMARQPYLGAVVGRVANRITGACFELDGARHDLDANDGGSHIHGGAVGFDKRLWAAQAFGGADGQELVLNLRSRDGDQGYPGNLDAVARYRLAEGALVLDLWATTDRATPVSLTNHSYFNLDGQGRGTVLDHSLTVFSDVYTPVDAALLPTGEVRLVAGTPFDFRHAKRVGAELDHPSLKGARGVGYDTNFVVRGVAGTLRPAARLSNAAGDLTLELWSSQPALQVYTGNYLDGSLVGKAGAVYGPHAGIAMEPQSYPDAVNVHHFPSTILRPGAVYHETIEYRFK